MENFIFCAVWMQHNLKCATCYVVYPQHCPLCIRLTVNKPHCDSDQNLNYSILWSHQVFARVFYLSSKAMVGYANRVDMRLGLFIGFSLLHFHFVSVIFFYRFC